jgi:GxxExxY protein
MIRGYFVSLSLLHEELTGLVRQVSYETHLHFGTGFLEKVYENALARRLRKKGLNVLQQVPVVVRDEDGAEVGDYYADLLVNDALIVELKAVKNLANEHWAQVINYLKATRYNVGLLVNFGSSKFQFRRVVFTRKEE